VTTIQTPLTINTDDLTLAELDRVVKLTEDGRCGRTAAIAFVWLKREHPAVRLDDVLALRTRDLDLIDDDDVAERAAEAAERGEAVEVAVDPTQGPS
jgi:hypothetical protein